MEWEREEDGMGWERGKEEAGEDELVERMGWGGVGK